MDTPEADAPEVPVRPVLRIVRGTPSPEELAVLTALVSASGGGQDSSTPAPRSRWADPVHGHRRALRPGPGAWSASARG